MGTKIKEFRQYNNLFTELVRKGIKLNTDDRISESSGR